MDKHKVLDQILAELHRFLSVLDKETLSGTATVQKGLLAELLLSYSATNGGDEEYIYMNKVTATGKENAEEDDRSDALANGKAGKHVPAPQKSLPDLPPPRTGVVGREPFPLPATPVSTPGGAPPPPTPVECVEGYYEEAQPYEQTINDDGEAVSSSYESYDEEEVTRGKCSSSSSSSAQHQWPSAEASIELMKDARICAFLWRKKWLGQWAKQLCVVKDQRLLCYKSSKEQTPLLDVSLLGCSVVYKEKHQPRRKEHKLKIVPLGGEAIVLGLQSKEQTEQWLKVIQDISPRPAESCDSQHVGSDSPRLICTKGELSERQSVASESGSSTDSHADTPDTKDVKKKYGAGLKFSNLMNIGKKKPSSLESPEKCVDTSGYLNVLVNSQWRPRWCLIKDGQLWFYQDKGKTKASQPAVPLEGCSVLPDPSPEHLYSFSISLYGTQLAALEARSSADMGHWLGLLLSQTGTKTDPEELTYDYVSADRISTIVSAAKTSLYLMQRRYSEPNTYIDNLPSVHPSSDELYDDVASIAADPEEDVQEEEQSLLPDGEDHGVQEELSDIIMSSSVDTKEQEEEEEEEDGDSRVYLDLLPVRSFLHTTPSGCKTPPTHRETPTSSPGPPTEEEEEEEEQPGPMIEVDSTEQSEPETPPTVNGASLTPPISRAEQARPLSPALLRPSPPHPHKTPSAPGQDPTKKRTTGRPGSPQNPQASSHHPHRAPHSPGGPAHHQHPHPPHSPQPPRGRSTSSGDKPKAWSLGCPGSTEVKPGKNRTETGSTEVKLGKNRTETGSTEVKLGKNRTETGSTEVKLGKNRTEADMRLYTDQRQRLERDREELRSSLASLKKERREMKEELNTCTDPVQQASLEATLKQKEEACREAERRRVEVELLLMEVKESLRKAEAGPFTLGTTLDSSLQEAPQSKAPSLAPPPPCQPSNNSSPSGDSSSSPVNSATALKNRPASMMSASKGNVLQKAKEWEKKSTT